MKKIFAIGLVLVVFATVIFSADMKIGWNHTGTTNDVIGYDIYYGNSSHNYGNHIVTGYVTNIVISNLPPNTPIFIAGATIGQNNFETEFGNEIQFNPSSTNGLPTMVKNFRITNVTQTIY